MNSGSCRTAVINGGFLVGLLYILFFCTMPAWGQEDGATRAGQWKAEREKKDSEKKAPDPFWLEKYLKYIQEKRVLERWYAGWHGFHSKIGGMPTGGGFALGVRFDPEPRLKPLMVSLEGSASFREYQQYALRLDSPRMLDGRMQVGFVSQYSSFPQEDFYGLGRKSRRRDRMDFGLELAEWSGKAELFLTREWKWGVRLGYLRTNVGRGTDKEFPNIEWMVPVGSLPGLDRQPHYGILGAFMEYDGRDEPGNPRSGGYLQSKYTYYDDRRYDRYTFRQVDAEAQYYIPFYNKRRVLAFRALSTLTVKNSGQDVPFFMMKSLGGSASLRGYEEYRFRDRNRLLLNMEYRFEAFSGLDVALFGDAGQVSDRRSGFELEKMESDVGFGFRFNTGKMVFLRFDVGFSHEGTRFFWKFGPAF